MSYDYLRSRPSKSGKSIFEKLGVSFFDVVNLPISYLNLDQNVLNMLNLQRTFVDGRSVPKFQTMGDLVKFGYVEMQNLSERREFYLNSDAILYNIELSLARYALKLRGTEFTIYDIRVDDLSLSAECKAFAKQTMRAKTLGDLYAIGASRFKDYFDGVRNGSKIKQDILNAMMEFGTAPEKIYRDEGFDDVGLLPSDSAQYVEEEAEEEHGAAKYLFKSVGEALKKEQDRKANATTEPVVKTETPVSARVSRYTPDVTYKVIPNEPPLTGQVAVPSAPAKAPEPTAVEEKPKPLSPAQQIIVDRYNELMSHAKFIGRYDYSKLLMLVAERYVNLSAFLKDAKLTSGVMSSIYKGVTLKDSAIKSICRALHCEASDIMEKNKNFGMAAAEEAEKSKRAKFVTNQNATRSGRTVHVGGSIPADIDQKELLSLPIERLGLNWKYVKLLKYSFDNMETIGDLVSQSKASLIRAGISEHIASQINLTLKSYGLCLTDGRTLPEAVTKRKKSISTKRLRRRSEVNVTAVQVKPVHTDKLLEKSEGSAPATPPPSGSSHVKSPFGKGKKDRYYSAPNGYVRILGQRVRMYDPNTPISDDLGKQL